MKAKRFLVWTGFTFLLYVFGCAAFQVAGDVQAGRNALQTGRPLEAVVYLTRAAELDPNYLTPSRIRVGALTYLGRAYYEIGKNAEARSTLERAVSINKDDSLAHLYLGLTLLRSGDRERGRKEIDDSLKAIDDTLEYIAADRLTGFYWDPTMQIRNYIRNTLGRKLNDAELAAAAERIGRDLDEEFDRARRDEAQHRGGSDSGGGS